MTSDHRDYKKIVVEGLVAQLLTGNKYKLKLILNGIFF